MHRFSAALAAAIFTSALGAAFAQTPPSGALFINPMGQPFRAEPGNSGAPILVWLAHADIDLDERIGRDEFVTEAMAFFADALDANGDQSVIPLESTEFRRVYAPETLSMDTTPIAVAPSARQRRESATGIRGARPEVRTRTSVDGISELGPPPSRDQPTPQRRSGRLRQDEIMLGAEIEPVMSCDRDFSRRIDAAEFQACAERRFVALDLNRDGYFTLDESERARAMLAAYSE